MTEDFTLQMDDGQPESGAEVACSDWLDERRNAHKVTSVMFSSERMDWPTPQYVFDALNLEFNFTLDPCCHAETAKCQKYYTPKEDGLAQDWSGDRVFMNPPYGKFLPAWMEKAFAESQRGALVVCLVPSRTDTRWWHDWAMKGEIRLFPKRFYDEKHDQMWPFPCAVVVFRPRCYQLRTQLI